MGFYFFSGIQASYAGLFDAKKERAFRRRRAEARLRLRAKEIN